MSMITNRKHKLAVHDAVRLERDRARVTLAAEQQARHHALDALDRALEHADELERQVEALIDQAGAQTEARNNDALRINDLVTANDNQVTLIEDQKKVIAFERENAATWKRALELDNQATEIVELNKRISHLQDQMQEFDNVWDVLCQTAIEVANSNGYCEEYDNLIEQVNDALERQTNGYRKLWKRTKEYWVSMTLDVLIEEAVDEDDAQQQAKDNLDAGRYDTSDLDNYGYSVREN